MTSARWFLPLKAGSFVENQIIDCLQSLKSKYSDLRVLLGAGAEYLSGWIEQETNWVLYGNNSFTIQSINDPEKFFSGLQNLDINFPDIEFNKKPNDLDADRWIYKYTDTCGGIGITRNPPSLTDANGYWQREIVGEAISALYVADGESSYCVGINLMHSRQFGGNYPYVYSGAIANHNIDKKYIGKIDSYAKNIIDYFKLIGVISIDMMLEKTEDDCKIYVLEVNPRISASFELYEYLNPNINLVDEHIRVCEGDTTSISKRLNAELTSSVAGYRIVYAYKDGVVEKEILWPEWSKDIPEEGRHISIGEPICSVFANEYEGNVQELLNEREKTILSYIN